MDETLTESQLIARISALQSARDTGALIVRHGDTQTQFRSLEEMNSTLASLRGQLSTLQGKSRSRVTYIRQSCKGL